MTCAGCYVDNRLLPFPVSRAYNDEPTYFKRRKEKETKYLVARPGDGVISPFQCDRCWFLNLHGRLPMSSSLSDDRELALIRRANLDMFWSRESSTVSQTMGSLKELIGGAKSAGRLIPLEGMTPWKVGDDEGMGVAIAMLEKSIKTSGANSSEFLQFSTIRKLRSASANVFAATSQASTTAFVMKTSAGAIQRIYSGGTQSVLLERFVMGLKARMPHISKRNKPITSVMVNYVLDALELEWSDRAVLPERRRIVLMTAAYIATTFGYSLRGNEGFWVDAQRLIDNINVGKYDTRAKHVTICLLGRFKGEEGDRMHVFPLASVTRSGIRIRLWLERLVRLLRTEGKTGCPAFCDEDGYQLSAADLEAVMHPILRRLQSDESKPDVILPGLDVETEFRMARSLRRGSESEALDQGVPESTVRLVNRWGSYERNRGAEPGFDMLDHYAASANTRYKQISYSAVL